MRYVATHAGLAFSEQDARRCLRRACSTVLPALYHTLWPVTESTVNATNDSATCEIIWC